MKAGKTPADAPLRREIGQRSRISHVPIFNVKLREIKCEIKKRYWIKRNDDKKYWFVIDARKLLLTAVQVAIRFAFYYTGVKIIRRTSHVQNVTTYFNYDDCVRDLFPLVCGASYNLSPLLSLIDESMSYRWFVLILTSHRYDTHTHTRAKLHIQFLRFREMCFRGYVNVMPRQNSSINTVNAIVNWSPFHLICEIGMFRRARVCVCVSDCNNKYFNCSNEHLNYRITWWRMLASVINFRNIR